MQEKSGELNGINKVVLENTNDKINVRKGLKAFGRISKPLHKAIAYSTEFIPGVSGDESSAIQFLSEIGLELKKGEEWRTLNDLSDEEEKMLITNIIMKRLNKTENPEEIMSNVYKFKNKEGMLADAHEFATILNSCGRQNLQSIGVMLCLGESKDALKMAEEIIASYKKKLLKALKWVEKENNENVKKTEKVMYIIGKENISDTMIGTICSILASSKKVEQSVIIGFADSENGVKVSGRLTKKEDIDIGKLIKEVVESLGGEGGGHGRAGGAKIQKGQESEFIDKFEQTINNIKG
jgi:RecJ-like exonuclease